MLFSLLTCLPEVAGPSAEHPPRLSSHHRTLYSLPATLHPNSPGRNHQALQQHYTPTTHFEPLHLWMYGYAPLQLLQMLWPELSVPLSSQCCAAKLPKFCFGLPSMMTKRNLIIWHIYAKNVYLLIGRHWYCFRKSGQKAVESTLRRLCIALDTTHTFVFTPQNPLHCFRVKHCIEMLHMWFWIFTQRAVWKVSCKKCPLHTGGTWLLSLFAFFRKLLQHKTTQTSSQMTVCQAASSSQNHFLLPCICVFTLLQQWERTSNAKQQFFMQTHSPRLKHGESNITL